MCSLRTYVLRIVRFATECACTKEEMGAKGKGLLGFIRSVFNDRSAASWPRLFYTVAPSASCKRARGSFLSSTLIESSLDPPRDVVSYFLRATRHSLAIYICILHFVHLSSPSTTANCRGFYIRVFARRANRRKVDSPLSAAVSRSKAHGTRLEPSVRL